MNKLTKLVLGASLGCAIAVGGALGLSACAKTNSYYGEYHYPNAWDSTAPDYGVKVKVTIQSDKKGERIKSIEIIDSVYTEVSEGWANKDIWFDNVDELVRSYRGKYLLDVLVAGVKTNAVGQPEAVTDPDLSISGATQGSGRVLLAVQSALKDAAQKYGYTVCEGEYHYPNAWAPTAPDYGIRVRVVVKNEKIAALGIIPSGYTEVSDSWGDKDIWLDNVESLLNSYKGKPVSDVLAVSVGVNENGQPESVSDPDFKITGATQGSGRLLKAVQNALKNGGFAYELVEGDYHYDKYGHTYGIKVSVLVNGSVITSVNVLDSDYVSASPEGSDPSQGQWPGRHVWDEGLAGLLKSYEGKSVAHVLAQTVEKSADGEPTSVTDSELMITDATQGSGRLMLAVQNALSKLEGYTVCEGEYHYPNAYAQGAPDYGIKVKVVVESGKVAAVGIVPSDYTEVSDSWQNKNTWLDNVDGLLKSYEGKSVDDVLSAVVTTSEKSEPQTVSDPDLMITGATQGSGRLLIAVQNALCSLSGYSLIEGQYTYNNQYNAGYGIKAQVIMKGSVILGVRAIAIDGYRVASPEGSDPSQGQWANRHLWDEGLAGLLQGYSGKTAGEVLALSVACDSYGQPNEESISDPDLVISGATQGSGRLLIAVQNALKESLGYEVADGDYHYDNYSHTYGIKVRVVVKDDKIVAVGVIPSDYVSASPEGSGVGQWPGRHVWDEGLADLLKRYEGKSVSDVTSATVGLESSGQPNSVSDPDLVITDATQGSGRLLKAVQDALSKLN